MASSDEDRRCGTCRWWEPGELTPTGRVRKTVHGECNFEIVPPVVPSCVTEPVKIYKLAAWFEDGTKCPCWAKESGDAK